MKSIAQAMLSLTLLASLSACYTPIQVKKVDKSKYGTGWEDGVPFYLPQSEVRYFTFTKLVIDDVVTTDCESPPTMEEYVSVPETKNMYTIRSHDFFFGQNTFGVELKDGVLVGVNSVRDPQVDEMLNAVVGAAKTGAQIAAGAPPVPEAVHGVRDCNAGKRYVAKPEHKKDNKDNNPNVNP